MRIDISQAAHILGVSRKTLRRWDQEGKLPAERTLGGHRRYDLAQ
ncbi:MAG: helix-turn-helix domain-containing protein, partial [Chloroflexia bacterium]|nr:helix-turn-helix domain-containing protein [Chloroflexia bacterium]